MRAGDELDALGLHEPLQLTLGAPADDPAQIQGYGNRLNGKLLDIQLS